LSGHIPVDLDKHEERCYNIKQKGVVKDGMKLKAIEDSMPWADAEKACKNLGEGWNLASILNQKEQDQVAAFYHDANKSPCTTDCAAQGARFWIGLNDRKEEGKLVWSDGHKLEYSAWQPGEPNNVGSGEDCVEVGNWFHDQRDVTEWNDHRCELPRQPLCQMRFSTSKHGTGKAELVETYKWHGSGRSYDVAMRPDDRFVANGCMAHTHLRGTDYTQWVTGVNGDLSTSHELMEAWHQFNEGGEQFMSDHFEIKIGTCTMNEDETRTVSTEYFPEILRVAE